jgi:C-terminal processing protease CtpA/Prc
VLGITVRPVSDQTTGQTQLQVVDVLPGWPADGKLQPQDIIIAVDQVPLDTDNPRAQFRRLVLEQAERGAIKFTVRRNEAAQEVRIELGSSAQTQPKTLNPELKDAQRPTIKLRAKPEVAEIMIRTLRLLRQAIEPAAERYHRLTVTAVNSPSGQINIEATIK